MTVQPKFRLTSIKPDYPVIYGEQPYKHRVMSKGIPKQPITRPPAIYSNLSHEEVLNSYWDQLDVDSQKKYLKEMYS